MTKSDHHVRMATLMHRAAEQTVPDPIDLWPQIAAEVEARRMPRTRPPEPAPRRLRIAFVALPALLIVVLLAVIVLSARGDGEGVRFASIGDVGTPTVSPVGEQVSSPSATPFLTMLPPVVQPSDVPVVTATPSPLAQPASLSTQYTTYTSAELDLTFSAPADWLPYQDPALNRDDVNTTAISFYDDVQDMHPLTEGAPEHGPALVILRIWDADALGLGAPSDIYSARDVFEAVLGMPLPFEFDRGRWMICGGDNDGENPLTVYVLIAPPGEGVSQYEDLFNHVLESVGIRFNDIVLSQAQDFIDGVYTHADALSRDKPIRIYTFEAQQIPDPVIVESTQAGAQGWMLGQVAGAYRTPLLQIDYATAAYTNVTQYASSEGAILFPIPVDAAARTGDFLRANVDGHSTYTFTLRPVMEVIDIGVEPVTITVETNQPVVLRFDVPDDNPAHLRIDTLEAMSMEEALQSRILSQPRIEVLLPYGDALTSFEPRRSQSMQIDFMPPMQGHQYIVLNPVDLCLMDIVPADCASYTRSPITLSASIDATMESPASAFIGAPEVASDGTVTLNECVTALESGTPPSARPLDAYTIMEHDATMIDLAAEHGAPVHATGAGTVIYAGWQRGGYGSTVVIAHGETYSVYAHLSATTVQCGEPVQAGQQIGNVGSTGNATGPHLHFEVRDAAFEMRDPAAWITF